MIKSSFKDKVAVALVMCSVFISISCDKEKKVVTPIKVEFKKEGELQIHNNITDSIVATFNIEIADNDYERQRGLMNRSSMREDQAMLFIFPDTEYRSFFMKNTMIPLDIIYFDQDGKLISVQDNAQPYNETGLPSAAPAMYVLEVNAGLTEKLDLRIGDRITYLEIE